MKIAVSIVNFNTKHLTIDCIKSILEQKSKYELEVWIVDNASNDGSVEMINEFIKDKGLKKFYVVENKKNVGFAAGHNIALRKIKADYVLILNSDTLLNKGVIDEMVNFMEKNKCFMATCKVFNLDGSLQPNTGDFPIGLGLLGWLFNLESLGIKWPAFHINDLKFYKQERQVDWVSGNFMMLKKEVIDKVGLFNESYFMYFEDVEYCYRAKKIFKIMINPQVSIKHLSGGSLDDPKFRQWGGEYKGLLIFYKQHFGQFLTLLIRILVYFAIILRIFAFLLTGKIKYSLTYGKIITTI